MCRLIRVSLLSLWLSMTVNALAREVNPQQVRQVVQTILERINSSPQAQFHLSAEPLVITNQAWERLAYLQQLQPQGFLLLSTDDETAPLLGYSTTHNFSIQDPDNPLWGLLKSHVLQATDTGPSVNNKPSQSSQRPEAPEAMASTSALQTIWPEPGTTKTGGWVETLWHQLHPFNARCPYDSINSGRSLVGCLGIAMAQVINYHGVPANVTDFSDQDDYTSVENGFTFRIDDQCGEDGSLTWEELNASLDSLSYPLASDSDSGLVDELCYATSVAIKTGYSAKGSGANEGNVVEGLKQRFGFLSADWKLATPELFDNLKHNMKNALPAIVVFTQAGYFAHAMVADGFDEVRPGSDDDLYHLNYGGGRGGDFAFWWNLVPYNNIDPPTPGNFTVVKGAIANISPRPFPPVAQFAASPTSGYIPLQVRFNDLSYGTVSSWSWDFGDGSPLSQEQHPIHTYASAGTFSVTSTVSNPAGEATITKDSLIVAEFSLDLFTEAPSMFPPGLRYGAGEWADFDRDGDLDILLVGAGIARIYRNDAGAFRDIGASLTGVEYAAASWGDLDNDNDPDILIAGRSGPDLITKIYRNDNGVFVDILAPLRGFYWCNTDWGDYDNDGDADILLAGSDSFGGPPRIYQNHQGQFVDISATLPASGHGCWVDYDNDSDLDLALVSGSNVLIYQNHGGRFDSSIVAFQAGHSLSWGDYDRDGDLDAMISGTISTNYFTKVFRNDDGKFTDISAPLQGVEGEAEWADYDNDGALDVLVAGKVSSDTYITKLYRNNLLQFEEVQTPLKGVGLCNSIAWGDYDADGDLDVLLTGDQFVRVYRNNVEKANTRPHGPYDLKTKIEGHRVAFSWTPQEDAETCIKALTYDLCVGTEPGLGNIVSPLAELAGEKRGHRYLSVPGNAGQNLQAKLNLPPGTYYWTVQAIDQNFAGSGFTRPEELVIEKSDGEPPASPQNFRATRYYDSIKLTWSLGQEEDVRHYGIYRSADDQPENKLITVGADVKEYTDREVQAGRTYSYRITATDWSLNESAFSSPETVRFGISFANVSTNIPGISGGIATWGDYDNDSDLDLLQAGNSTLGYMTFLSKNDHGQLDGPAFLLDPVYEGAAAWGDYDNDGDLDILSTGDKGRKSETRIFQNDSLKFVNPDISLLGIVYGMMGWGDYDNDGDLDAIIAGRQAPYTISQPIAKIFRNERTSFADILAPLTGVQLGSCAWGNFDNDCDLDLLLSGGISEDFFTKLYINMNGQFVDSGLMLPGGPRGNASWGDYDSDGDLDILLADQEPAKIYRNNSGLFELVSTPMPTASFASFGDCDNDGDLDVLLIHSNMCRIFRNTGNDFVDTTDYPANVVSNQAYWSDYDNDGDLDALLTRGSDTNCLVWRNEISVKNTVPDAPQNLTSVVAGDSVVLSWSPATDSATLQAGLSYNLRVGTTPGGEEIMPAMADLTTGYRRIVAMGNAQLNTSWKLKGLSPGIYYWSVQAIDNCFAGSSFSEEQSFTISKTGAATDPPNKLPAKTALLQNYPNPFNASTSIRFDLHRPVQVQLMIFNLQGQIVHILVDRFMQAGEYSMSWDGTTAEGNQAPSGVYICQLQAGNFRALRKMVVVR